MSTLPACWTSTRSKSYSLGESLTLRMFHRRDLCDGQGRRRSDRCDEARKGPENHGNCGSPWLAALGHTPAANHHEVRLVQLCFDFYMIEAKPANLIGDRAYDSDPLDEQLRRDGIEMIAPHRSNRSKPATQICRRRTIIVGGVGRRAVIIRGGGG